jgi:hypothetical protein
MNSVGVVHPAPALCFCGMILSEKSATFRDHALVAAMPPWLYGNIVICNGVMHS